MEQILKKVEKIFEAPGDALVKKLKKKEAKKEE